MLAIVQDSYGSADVLQLRAIPAPVVRDREVLVRVRATSVHPDVWHVLTGRPYVLRIMGAGVRRPRTRVPGTDVAGQVEAVGRRVTRFRPRDEVFGECVRGHQWHNGGAFAEYVAVRERASRRGSRSSRLRPSPPRGSSRCRASATRAASRPGSGSSSTARAAAWARWPCSSPRPRARS
jgi:NADPH:quinone reductase-like Zn-dependent oxidoreductase